jgi:GNAT-family acetyltransferase (TIGR03103 family)
MAQKRFDPRVRREDTLSTRTWGEFSDHVTGDMARGVTLECGWGRLIFGQTFADQGAIKDVLQAEQSGRRDIALYLRDPHVLVSKAPDELFIDPSLTYRLWLHRYRPAREPLRGVIVRKMRTQDDADATNRIYAANGMVTADAETMWANQRTRTFTYLVAEDAETGDVIGTVTGVDHRKAFRDPERGSSLWCLAVDPQAQRPGVGQALVRTLAERYQARGNAYMDLSVMHDNSAAIALYEKLGFVRVPVFVVKRKNPINEPLFVPASVEEGLNPYARIIAEEARRRGIAVRVIDPEWGEMALSHGGREIITRESLSELTSAIAMSRCDDKRVTRRVLESVGLRVPRGRAATGGDEDRELLAELGELVVKPARGEQGDGITVGVTDPEQLARAVEHARTFCRTVLLEEVVEGQDLRVIVIDREVVAAAVRRPATVLGTGKHSIGELIEKQSRRRAAATDGESRIPLDEHTRETLRAAGHELDDVLPEGETLQVRRTANLHTGGTIHDVTEHLHPALADACITAAGALDIPVVGLDLLVPTVEEPEYVFIEANERPGLANHEPQPTAQRFVDLLFPQTRHRDPAQGPVPTSVPNEGGDRDQGGE